MNKVDPTTKIKQNILINVMRRKDLKQISREQLQK